MAIKHATDENFNEMTGGALTLVDFWAPWCGPCNLLSPVLTEIAEARPDIKVCKVNVDAERELTKRYKVYRIPTLLVMNEGQEEDRITGARSKEELTALFD